jgi:hypothetical protein
MVYIHRRNFDNRSINIYCIKSVITHRGHNSITLITKNKRPPERWFETPKKSGELVIAISNIVVERKFIKFDKYVATIHPSSMYSKPVQIEEVLNNPHIKWID